MRDGKNIDWNKMGITSEQVSRLTPNDPQDSVPDDDAPLLDEEEKLSPAEMSEFLDSLENSD